MVTDARVAYVNSQILCARAEIESMLAANSSRAQQGCSDAYGEEAFLAVPAQYGLDHNTVVAYLRKD